MNDDIYLHVASEDDAQKITRARAVPNDASGAGETPYANVGALLQTQTERYGEKPWLVFYSETGPRREYSYNEFFSLVQKTARLLFDFGARRGDRICTMGINHADTVIQYFAAWYIGAAAVPINVGEDDNRVEYIVNNSHAKLAFIRAPHVERFSALRVNMPDLETVVEVGEHVRGAYPSFHAEIAKLEDGFEPPEPVALNDDALIVYTSGTTGLPKGVVLDHYNLLIDAKGIAEWHRMDDSQRMMCVLPIHHVNGTVVTLMTPMYFGGSVVLNEKFHTHRFFERIVAENVQVVSVVPTLLQFLIHEQLDIAHYDLARFRHIICGAGPLTCELAARFEGMYGIPIMHGYGLSETTCYSCFLPVDLSREEHERWMQKFGFPSIGAAIPQNEMDIHTPTGESLPEGERGEIVIRGFNVMRYYYKNPEANTSAFANAWFRSGDEGFYKTDEQGRKFFFITGRIKELIIRGGINLAPLEIDEVINRCPGVKSGIAVGFDNDWYGEEVGALVMKADPFLTEESVLAFCHKHLPFSKSPKVVVFSDSIPVTSTGKYQRNKVKHLFEQWKAEQFKK